MDRVFFRLLTPWFAIMLSTGFSQPLGAQNQGDSIRSPIPNASLIELGLTTSREKQRSAEGAFTASIMAKSGLVTNLYNCQNKVSETADGWARDNRLKLIEKKSSLLQLHLAYSSKDPPGNFLLDYSVSPKTDDVTEAKISLSFRSLSNVRFSGDDVGLAPLGQRLLQAIQCVPHR